MPWDLGDRVLCGLAPVDCLQAVYLSLPTRLDGLFAMFLMAHGEKLTRVAAFASGKPLSTELGGAAGGRGQQATADPGGRAVREREHNQVIHQESEPSCVS